MRAGTNVLILAAWIGSIDGAIGQISLTSDIFPFAVGHERAYATHSSQTTNVAGFVGAGGGPRVWDFSDGPGDDTYRYLNVEPADSPSPGGFPAAMIAEKLSLASTGQTAFTYYGKSDRGRELLGFFDGLANPEFPLVVLTSPLRDFPRLIEFGSQWSDTTTFPTQQILLGTVFDLKVTLHIESRVDAFGTMFLPGRGKIDVLRVNELDRQETLLDVGGDLIVLSDIYVRVLYWISREFGIVAQITSEASEQIPDTDTLVTASRFLRLIEFRNPDPFQARITPLGNSMVRLNWSELPGVDYYDIETTTSLDADDWRFWMSIDATSVDAPVDSPFRAFRIMPAAP